MTNQMTTTDEREDGSANRPTAVTLLGAWCDALARLDMTGCVDLLAADAVVRLPFAVEGLPDRLEGRAAIDPVFAMIGGMFSRLTWTRLELHTTDDPELAVAFASSKVDLTRGGEYIQDYVLVARERGGVIIEYTEYADPIRAAAALAA
ncbi:MAG: uncharacterized protein JWO02_3289 [Solirubrobacterales bacterium]|nr:uncharacterized protein [Solirubrobacterales bacterium]